jgi:anti-sigma factor RsiW
MNENLELKLQALADGELPPHEAARIRALVNGDGEAARLLAELQAVKSALHANEVAQPVPETREFYWSKIARQIEHKERSHSARPFPWGWRLRRWLAALGAATALAVVLVVAVHLSVPQAAFNQVSVTADGFEARTFRDQRSGLVGVFLHDTKTSADASTPPAHVRDEGSSFNVEVE